MLELYRRIFGVETESEKSAEDAIELNCLRKTYLENGFVYGEDCNGNRWQMMKKA